MRVPFEGDTFPSTQDIEDILRIPSFVPKMLYLNLEYKSISTALYIIMRVYGFG